jgi:hypothetical protein
MYMYKKLIGAARSATTATLLVLGLAGPSVSQAASPYLPIPITPGSYNQDAIVESNATPRLDLVTTATVDNGTNNTANTWFELGYDTANPLNGLPAAGSTIVAISNANYSFKMPPTYVGPNGILIDTAVTSGAFALTTPAAYTLLSFLGSGGNGGDVIGVTVNHQDGTVEVGSFGCPDWFSGTVGVAYIAGGRCQNPVTFTTETDGANPRLYYRDIALTNTTSPVTNVVLSYVSGSGGSHNDVLAMSGATTPGGAVGPITVTGYTYDFVVEASAAKRGKVVSQIIVGGTNVYATTQTYDNDVNTGFTFYEIGHDFNVINNGPNYPNNPVVLAIAKASGLPWHGSTFTNAAGDHAYKMAPDYTTNDVVWVNPVITNTTITLVTPAAYSALSVLDAAGNGPVYTTLIIHHQNGNSETNDIQVNDWFSGNPPMFIPNGRVTVDSGQWSQQLNTTNGADRLFNNDFLLTETVSPVTTIDVVYTNTGGRVGIFAISGIQGTAPPIFTQQPVGTNVYAGSPFSMSVGVTGTGPFTYQWQKGTNGVFVNLADGGRISGSSSTTLVDSAADYFADGFDYRAIVANGGGAVTSAVATASVLSSLTDVTQPGDTITFFGGTLFGDGAVSQAIDNTLATKWGANTSTPLKIGCVITPGVGATLLNAMRFYTANDTTARDPADYKLEGSIDGGAHYTLIVSNSMTLPDGRNTAGSPPDPTVAFVKEVYFPNSNGYTTYRLTFSHLKGGDNSGSFQLGELELLGVTTNLPLVVSVPSTAKAFDGGSVSIAASVTGTPAPNSRWQKQISSVFTDLADGGTISGSHTATLTINPAHFADAGSYRIIATNSLAAVTSAVVQVSIYSTNVDVTQSTDTITDFGNTSTTATVPFRIVDDTFLAFTTRGSGINNNAGFPPFAGPVGVVETPVGPTIVSGIRVYTGSDGAGSDPADVKLEGSNNGGTSYTTILGTTALSLPDDRNATSSPIDPTQTAAQEILFANSQTYTSYRVTFVNTKDNNNVSFMSVGEIELLGVVLPNLTIGSAGGGNLQITTTVSGELFSKTNLTAGADVWHDEGPITAGSPVLITPGPGNKFYRVHVQ